MKSQVRIGGIGRLWPLLIGGILAGCGGNGTAPTAPPPTAAVPSSLAVVSSPSPLGRESALPSASPAPALPLLWEKSGPKQPSPCCQTWWPAIDPKTGDIWVANAFANEYWVFTPDGTFVEAWGKSGSGRGEFDFSAHRDNPQAAGGIAFAPDGSFYVADVGNHRIQHFDSKRNLVTTWGSFGTDNGQFAAPFGIATDGKTVYVADDDRGDIQAFDASGNYLRTFGGITQNAGIFIALDAAGNIYRSGEGTPTTLTKYDPTGTAAGTIDIDAPGRLLIGLAVGPSGHIFANLGHDNPPGRELAELDASGNVLNFWSTGGETAVVDPSGKAIYMASDAEPDWPTASLRKYALPGS